MNEQPHPEPGVRLLPWRLLPWLGDAVLVGLVVLGLIGRRFIETDANTSIEWLAAVVAVVVILGRRRYPIPALGIGVITTAIVVAIAEEPSVIMPVVLIALFNVATRYDSRTALIAGISTIVIFSGLVVAIFEQSQIVDVGLAAIAWPAFATAAGAAVRAIRENLAAAHDRARRAEATQELEARRRVTEERLRIARDVHDVVAHHIAVINVQSAVAGHVLRSDPDAAEAALGAVRDAASTAVEELGGLLGVLRAAGDKGGPVDPTPDLEAIGELISSFSASGLEIAHQTSGAPRPLSPSTQIAAYRVVPGDIDQRSQARRRVGFGDLAVR